MAKKSARAAQEPKGHQVERNPATGQFAETGARFDAVMRAAEQSGLLSGKSGRIGGRVSPALVAQAKRQTGIETDTDLIAFALASVALEDNFADTFKISRGKVDQELKLASRVDRLRFRRRPPLGTLRP